MSLWHLPLKKTSSGTMGYVRPATPSSAWEEKNGINKGRGIRGEKVKKGHQTLINDHFAREFQRRLERWKSFCIGLDMSRTVTKHITKIIFTVVMLFVYCTLSLNSPRWYSKTVILITIQDCETRDISGTVCLGELFQQGGDAIHTVWRLCLVPNKQLLE